MKIKKKELLKITLFKCILVLFSLISLTNQLTSASLKITKYQPLTFRISFSENINLPAFQILVDNTNLEYKLLNSTTSGTIFDMEVTSDYHAADYDNTDSYSLLFNFPIDVQNGGLSLDNYILYPQKPSLLVKISTWPVYFVCVSLFICSLFGIIGLSYVDFLQIYILVQMKFKSQSTSIQTFSGIFFMDLITAGNVYSETEYLVRLILPTIIIIGCYFFGLLIKNLAAYISNHAIKKRIIKFFGYNLLLTVWTIVLPSVIYKIFQFLYDKKDGKIILSQTSQKIGILLTYLNFINMLAYFYVLYFVMNPKICQQSKQFRKYMMSPQFQLYNKFHRGLHLRNAVKRNLTLIFTIRKLIIIVLFFATPNITPFVLILQLASFFYLFTVRPYKQDFYTNISIVNNLIYFFFYLVVMEGFSYYDISSVLETEYSLSQFILSKTILFYVICLVGMIFSIVQGVKLFKDLKYEFKRDFEDPKSENNSLTKIRGRLLTESSNKRQSNMKRSLIFDSLNSPDIRKFKRETSPVNNNNNRPKKTLFQIQMEEFSPSLRKRNQQKQAKKKWKQKSVLESLASNQTVYKI